MTFKNFGNFVTLKAEYYQIVMWCNTLDFRIGISIVESIQSKAIGDGQVAKVSTGLTFRRSLHFVWLNLTDFTRLIQL